MDLRNDLSEFLAQLVADKGYFFRLGFEEEQLTHPPWNQRDTKYYSEPHYYYYFSSSSSSSSSNVVAAAAAF